MRIVHVAPRLTGTAADFTPALRELALAQAKSSSGKVQLVAAASVARQARIDDLELRTLPADRPRWLGRSHALRQYLADFPAEIVHAHCPGQRGLHYAHLAAQRHGAPLVVSASLALGLGARERLRLRCAFDRFLVHPQALEQAAGWHATSAEEADAIRACGFRQPICIAPPGVAAPTAAQLDVARTWWQRAHPVLASRPVALCTAPLSRRSRLRELIDLWSAANTGDWLLLLVGPTHGESPESLTAHAARRGAANRVLVALPGELPPHAVAHLFLGTSRTDTDLGNVATALAAGLPALVAADAPWSRLTEDHVGWCVPWKDFPATLRIALTLGPNGLAGFGRNARELAAREFTWARAAARLLDFYRNLRS
jgi:glycosyltransferase involved in cell wall biosynthesis